MLLPRLNVEPETEPCPDCEGGFYDIHDRVSCEDDLPRGWFMHPEYNRICRPCSTCGGSGRVVSETTNEEAA